MDTWIFDLDNTLYPATSAVFTQVEGRIRDYIADYFALSKDDAFRLQKKYFLEHGTTLKGLLALHGVDPTPYLDYVHDIDVSMVDRHPRLERALSALPGRRLIFTNANVAHAHRIMDRLGVRHLFDGIFDIADARYVPKPAPEIYRSLVERHRIHPASSILIDDLPRNLEPAAALGMTTVWMRTAVPWGQEGGDAPYVHHATDDLVEWLEAARPRRP